MMQMSRRIEGNPRATAKVMTVGPSNWSLPVHFRTIAGGATTNITPGDNAVDGTNVVTLEDNAVDGTNKITQDHNCIVV